MVIQTEERTIQLHDINARTAIQIHPYTLKTIKNTTPTDMNIYVHVYIDRSLMKVSEVIKHIQSNHK